jgi:hypothetical protein
MGRTYRAHGNINKYIILVGKLEGKRRLGRLGVDRRIILI